MSGTGLGSNTALSPPFFSRCNDVQACKINYAGLIRKHNWQEKGASPGKPTRFPDRTPHGNTQPRRHLSEIKRGYVPSVSLRGQDKGCASRRRRRRRRTSGGGSGHAPLEIALTFPIRLSLRTLPRYEFVQVEKQSQIQYWNNTNEWTRRELRRGGGLNWSEQAKNAAFEPRDIQTSKA